MDLLQLYQDYSVDFVTEGHKHTKEGWVNVGCPFCEGNPGYHLGYNLEEDYFHCWRCGGHPVIKTLALILRLPEGQIKTLIRQYGNVVVRSTQPVVKVRTKAFQYPSGTGVMTKPHRQYLVSRGFDPDRLERTWGLLGTGPVSELDGLEYHNRILIPYWWDGQVVSFDTRSISKSASHEVRYKACPKEREITEHKSILYGRQEHWGKAGICVEGPTDVWRLGYNSFAVSGIRYIPAQVWEIAKVFKRVVVCFDNESEAQIRSVTLAAELRFRGVDAIHIKVETDPGSMKQEDADYLVKQLIR